MDSIAIAPQLPSYEQFYGFAQPPFALAPDPRFLYRSESHDHAIAQLLQALGRREGFVVLTGEIGTGKTTVCRAVLDQIGPTTFTALILNPLASIDDLLREVLVAFGVVSSEAVRSGRFSGFTTHQLAATLQQFLQSLEPLGASALIVIDEAQHLAAPVLEQLRLISGQTAGGRLLQVLLVGQLNLLDLLGDSDLRQVNQRVVLRATLEPLDREALVAYVNWRLSVARSSTTVAFETKALDLVHAISGGVPRTINRLCDHALSAGAADTASDITPEHVRTAARELGLPAPRDSGWKQRGPIAALGLLAALLVAGAAILAAVPTDRLAGALSRPAAPVSPPRALAAPASALPPPTEDLLLPPLVQAPAVVRRAPLAAPPPAAEPPPRIP